MDYFCSLTQVMSKYHNPPPNFLATVFLSFQVFFSKQALSIVNCSVQATIMPQIPVVPKFLTVAEDSILITTRG